MIKNMTSVKNVLLENTVHHLQCYSTNKYWFPMVQLVGIVSSCKVFTKHNRCLFVQECCCCMTCPHKGWRRGKIQLNFIKLL